MFDWFKKNRIIKELSAALEDGVISQEEMNHLLEKCSSSGLDEGFLGSLIGKEFRYLSRKIIDEIENTGRCSPEQEARFFEIGERLSLDRDTVSEIVLESFVLQRILWALENIEGTKPPSINVPLMLKGGEKCYFATESIWKQLKTVRKTKGYAGVGVRIRVSKNVSFNLGGAVPVAKEFDALIDVSQGELFVTNKRIIFSGEKKSTNITFGRLLQVEIFDGGLSVSKTSGNTDFFLMTHVEAEYILAIVQNFISH
jgi:hypothetical protein